MRNNNLVYGYGLEVQRVWAGVAVLPGCWQGVGRVWRGCVVWCCWGEGTGHSPHPSVHSSSHPSSHALPHLSLRPPRQLSVPLLVPVIHLSSLPSSPFFTPFFTLLHTCSPFCTLLWGPVHTSPRFFTPVDNGESLRHCQDHASVDQDLRRQHRPHSTPGSRGRAGAPPAPPAPLVHPCRPSASVQTRVDHPCRPVCNLAVETPL